MLKNCPKVRNERMNMFMIYISARYETRMLLICFMVIGRFKNLRRKLGHAVVRDPQTANGYNSNTLPHRSSQEQQHMSLSRQNAVCSLYLSHTTEHSIKEINQSVCPELKARQ